MYNKVKKIKVIEAINPFVTLGENSRIKRKRVCAYARVSTDEEDQQNSFENQITEYQQRINNNPDWIFAGMYLFRVADIHI